MIDRENEIPPFVKRRDDSDDAGVLDGWDLWSVISSGDDKRDYATGEFFADIAIRISRERGDTAIITSTLAAIYLKQHAGLIHAGAIERGFIDRIARRAVAASMN